MNTRYRECDVIHLGGKCFFMMGLFVDLEIIEKINEKSNIQNKSWAPLTLIVGQVVAQVSALASLFFFPWTPVTATIAFGMYCGIMLGITMGYHRLYSHNSFNCPIQLHDF